MLVVIVNISRENIIIVIEHSSLKLVEDINSRY